MNERATMALLGALTLLAQGCSAQTGHATNELQGGGMGAMPEAGSDARTDASADTASASCAVYRLSAIAGEADATQRMQRLFNDAAASTPTDPSLRGPNNSPQQRVYIGPGTYRLRTVNVPSNLRVEFAPGARVQGVERALLDAYAPLFDFGARFRNAWSGMPAAHVENTTVTTGDGCGNAGAADSKPQRTSWRGNDPETGMANVDIQSSATWPLEQYFTVDLDSEATGAAPKRYGFLLEWVDDVLVENVFGVQNARRVPDNTTMSVGSVLIVQPPPGTPYPTSGDIADAMIAQRLTVRGLYTVLSPSGYGATQIHACYRCNFERIHSHGGVALRVETDGIVPMYQGVADRYEERCTETGPNGAGFDRFGIVDRLTANVIQSRQGNAAVYLSPHCLPNGRVDISNVNAIGSYRIVNVEQGRQNNNPESGTGYFDARSTLTNISGELGSRAQRPDPANDTYSIASSEAAVRLRQDNYSVRLRGSLCWTGSPDALPGFPLPPPGSPPAYTLTHENCPAFPPML